MLCHLPAGTEVRARVAAFPRGAVSGVEPIDRSRENGCSMRLQRVKSSVGSKFDMNVRAAERRMARSFVLPALPFLSDNRANRIRVIKGMMWGRCSVAIPPLVSSVSEVRFSCKCYLTSRELPVAKTISSFLNDSSSMRREMLLRCWEIPGM